MKVTVSADGFEAASRKLKLPEGKTEEVTFVLEPKCTQGSGPMRTVVAAAVGLLAMLGARPSWGGGAEPVRLPDGSALPAVDFDRHVASLFGRLGCNAGSLPRVVPGAGRAEPEPLRPRPRPRLPGDRPRGRWAGA